VRHPHVEQSVERAAAVPGLGQEALARASEVVDGLLGSGADLDHSAVHGSNHGRPAVGSGRGYRQG
jgi:hypothetical protein